MRALWWLGKEKKLSIRDDVPEPNVSSPTDVKIKIAFSGICGSDFHFMQGEMGKFTPKQDGVILGHEYSGEVVGVGEGCERIKVGDKVVVHPNQGCDNCATCDRNQPHFCNNKVTYGVSLNGGWAEFCVVEEKQVFKSDSKVTQKEAALSEPYACVMRGWRNMGELNPDKKVLIQGAGIIGLMFSCLFKLHKFKSITVVEPHDGRRELCGKLHSDVDVIHPNDLELQMSKLDSDVDGYDIIVDCTGNCKAVEKTIGYARRGAKISMFGCCPCGQKISVEPFLIYWKELSITGSFVSPFCFPDVVDLLPKLKEEDMLDVDKMGVKMFDLSQYEEAFQALRSGKASKSMFQF